jgi:hypothetical protein
MGHVERRGIWTSSRCSEESTTGPYPDSDSTRPRTHNPHLNVIFPVTPASPQMALPFKVKGKCKGKVATVLFNWAPRREGVLGEWKYSSTYSLTAALDGGEWSASRPGRFIPRERAPGTSCWGGWVGPRAGLDAVVIIKIPASTYPSKYWG